MKSSMLSNTASSQAPQVTLWAYLRNAFMHNTTTAATEEAALSTAVSAVEVRVLLVEYTTV